jgi:pyrroline-5-carboxylate reductase
VIEPQPSQELIALAEREGIALRAPVCSPGVLVLAMKPQNLDEAAASLGQLARPETLVISILAGKTIANIAARFPRSKAIVRAMPNLAAAIGRGMTVLTASETVNEVQRALAGALFAAAGKIEWLKGEELIDAATAVSGSGPAYVFCLTEALAKAGEAAGLPSSLAAALARGAVEGAGELLFQRPGVSPAEMRQSVTSPGGTTAAALEVLMAPGGLFQLIERAVEAARNRAAALSG